MRPADARVEEIAHLGLAEPVDRLHRIADGEQRAAVAVIPAGRQPADELELRPRRVLELVDEDVRDAQVRREQQLFRRVGVAERGQRAQRRLAEVRLAGAREHELQLRRERRQQRERCRDERPRVLAIARRRQRAHGVQRVREARHLGRGASHHARIAWPARSRSAAPAPLPLARKAARLVPRGCASAHRLSRAASSRARPRVRARRRSRRARRRRRPAPAGTPPVRDRRPRRRNAPAASASSAARSRTSAAGSSPARRASADSTSARSACSSRARSCAASAPSGSARHWSRRPSMPASSSVAACASLSRCSRNVRQCGSSGAADASAFPTASR